MRRPLWEMFFLASLVGVPAGALAEDAAPQSRYRRLENQVKALMELQSSGVVPVLEDQEKRLTALAARIEQLEGRVRAVEAQAEAAAQVSAPSFDPAPFRSQFASHQRRLQAIEARLDALEKSGRRFQETPSIAAAPRKVAPAGRATIRPVNYSSPALRVRSTGPAGYLLR